MKSTNTITCPHCKKPVDVSDVLSKKIKDQYEKEYQGKLDLTKKEYDNKYSEIKKLQSHIDQQQANLNEAIGKAVTQKIKSEKVVIEKKLREQIQNEKSDEIKSYQEQLELKIKETKELNKLKADFQRLTREKMELKEQLEVDMQTRLTKELSEAKTKIKDDIEKNAVMKIAEKDILINQLKDQLQNAQRKAEQGSTQLQGEAQEKAIEDYLINSFPTDEIEEIKKGARGADCLHIIKNPAGDICGRVYYESKRTKDFQNGWLEKFKTDMRIKNAIFGVLVTDAYPKDMARLGQKNGIWICSYIEFLSLCFVLRESVLLLHQAETSQENKGGKMELLYQYLTGTEFRGHIESIVEGFSQMNDDLAKERRALEGLWKQREKQLQKVILSTSQMYYSIRGISGNAIGAIQQLDLPGDQKLLS